jgi:probable HAF family extracellular repeat protein
LVVALLVPIAGAQTYTVTDLGPLTPTAINKWGQVVGNYNNHAFMWTRTHGLRDLGILPSGTFSRAAAINDLGMVTGTADGSGTVLPGIPGPGEVTNCSSGLVQPFIWNARSGIRGLGVVLAPGAEFLNDPCSVQFYATAISTAGQVVGYTERLPDEFQWGFTWTSTEGMIAFGGSWPPTFINGVSNTGQIVGENAISFASGHATSWKKVVNLIDDGTALQELGAPGYESSANGVNDVGQIVGWATTSPSSCLFFFCPMHAVLWSRNGLITDLGTLSDDMFSSATKINFFGVVIGSSGITQFREVGGQISEGFPEVVGRPFIWSQSRGMRDLNTLISTSSGWVLSSATDINIWGQIVGSGTHNGQPRGFLLTPRTLSKF